jgi:16S rRNA G966 N2-methylase RsmD
LSQLMDADGIFVLEKQPDEALPDMKQWRLLRQKTYGATEVLFLSGVRNEKFAIRN